MDPSNHTPTPINPRLVKFVMHQLVYGPEKNVHIVARRKFLDGLLTPEYLTKTVDQVEKRKLELFDEAVTFMLELGITITQTAKALRDQGLNEEDKGFMDRLIAEVNAKIEEEVKDDLFLP